MSTNSVKLLKRRFVKQHSSFLIASVAPGTVQAHISTVSICSCINFNILLGIGNSVSKVRIPPTL
jgi:hypothetical protein